MLNRWKRKRKNHRSIHHEAEAEKPEPAVALPGQGPSREKGAETAENLHEKDRRQSRFRQCVGRVEEHEGDVGIDGGEGPHQDEPDGG